MTQGGMGRTEALKGAGIAPEGEVRPLPIFFSQKIRRRGKIIFENAKQGKKGGLCVLFEIYFFRFIC